MKVIGIIAEYNPLHNGHLYHLEKIREMDPDALIILVLNGYFLERGEVSVINKLDKTKISLKSGIDIVLELPFVFGTQSADTFASTALQMLEELKCDYLVFGSESNDILTLEKIAKAQIDNKDYDKLVKKYLNEGLNYPTSLGKALNISFNFTPNDLLGISYIKAIKSNNYKIKPITIKRTNDYLDTTSDDDIVSATNIREKLKNKQDISKYVPTYTLKYIKNISLDDYFYLLKYIINTSHDLSIYLDVTEGIHNRLKKVINEVNSTTELINKVKTKRYTYNKIRRMLIHILIGFTKSDNQNLKLEYIRVLGFNKKGQEYLKKIKKEVNIPLTLNKNSLTYNYEIKASILYDLITKENNLAFEKRNKPLN